MKHVHTFESFLNESALSVVEYDEYIKPDYVEITLTDGRQLKVEKKRVKGRHKTYTMIVDALEAYNKNSSAKRFIDSLVNSMVIDLQ